MVSVSTPFEYTGARRMIELYRFNTVTADPPDLIANPSSSVDFTSATTDISSLVGFPSSTSNLSGTFSVIASSLPAALPPRDSLSLSSGSVAGIAVGSFVGAVAIIFLAWYLRRRRQLSRRRGLSSPILDDDAELPGDHRIDPFVVVRNNRRRRPRDSMRNAKTPSDKDEAVSESFDVPSTDLESSSPSRGEKALSVPDGLSSTGPSSGSSRSEEDIEFMEELREAIRRSLSALPTSSTTTGNASTSEGGTTPRSNSMNIQRLLEDRAFEGELLRFIAQRMDPPRPSSSREEGDDSPPVYRPPPP